jgi:hypothetical protein
MRNSIIAGGLVTAAVLGFGAAAAIAPAAAGGNPLPRHFQLDYGTGEPRLSNRGPYTVEECTSAIVTRTILVRCHPQYYVP